MIFKRLAAACFLLLAGLAFAFRVAWGVEVSPLEIRGLLHDWIQVTGAKDPDQPREIRRFIFKYRDTLKRISETPNFFAQVEKAGLLPVELKSPDWKPFLEVTQKALRNEKFRSMVNLIRPVTVAAIPEGWLKKASDQTTQAIAQIRVSDQESFHALMDPEKGFSIPDEEMRKIVFDIVPKYFDAMPVEEKRGIALGLLELPPDASWQEQVGAVVQNSDPFVQKIFQLVGEDVENPDLARILARLKSNVKPIPFEEVKKIVESRLGRRLEDVFSEFSTKGFSGTIGQTHKARLKSTGEWVAVKVRRPGVAERIRRAVKTMLSVCTDPFDRAMIEKAAENVEKEPDFRIEADNLKKGEIYLNPKKGIMIARLQPGMPHYEDLLITQWAKGKPIDDFTSPEELVQRGKAVYQFFKVWLDEAMFGGGFFHGDAHTGNEFLDLLPEDRVGYLLTILDFGSSGTLTRDEQRAFIRLAISNLAKSPSGVVEALRSIGKFQEGSDEIVRAKIESIFKLPLDPDMRLSEVMKSVRELKIDLPGRFLAYYRGLTFLQNQLEKINLRLGNLDPKAKLPRFSLAKAYAEVALKRSGEALPRHLLGSKAGQDIVLSRDLLKAVMKDMKSSGYRDLKFREICQILYARLRARIQAGLAHVRTGN